jgi:hypothetical protein
MLENLSLLVNPDVRAHRYLENIAPLLRLCLVKSNRTLDSYL